MRTDSLLLSRRSFVLAGASSCGLLVLQGCIPLGLFLRGGAARAFVAGTRAGGSASLLSLGRGVGIAGRAASSPGVQLSANSPGTKIMSKEGQLLATSKHSGQSTALMVGNRQVFRSNPNSRNHRDVGRLDHVDLNGNNVGSSRFETNGRVDHYTSAGRNSRRVGFDLVMRGGRLIRHFDRNENEIGSTDVEQNEVIADEHATTLDGSCTAGDHRHLRHRAWEGAIAAGGSDVGAH